ncbi:nucleoside-diphosphate kinase [Actinokineospora globicatena]|uniref:nucleoside-diphosphate kinase n=1 Tax=Actinokineospora globicatena TaxID=103729 RepID=UPI0020A41F5E|nr:nucleoside-diphosphate kinase [Actinokineospora globicatena]
MDHYRRETYYREALRDVERVLGDRATEVLHATALLMVKPDGIAAGKVEAVLDFLADRGFAVVVARRPGFTPLLWREMWRYQLTSATIDRLALNDSVYVGAGLLLLLRDERPDTLPATLRLASLKGSADLAKQRPGTLRDLLRQHNRNFSYIHVADEPADLVRELGLLLDTAQRRGALRALAAGAGPTDEEAAELSRLVTAERAAGTHRSFAPDEAGTAVAAALRRAEGGEHAMKLLEQLRAGAPVGWVEVVEAVRACGAEVHHWDLAALGAGLIVCDEPGERKVITNPAPGSWR